MRAQTHMLCSIVRAVSFRSRSHADSVGFRPVLRAAYEVQNENDQQDDHKNPDESVARSGNSKWHVPSFVVNRLSVSVSNSG